MLPGQRISRPGLPTARSRNRAVILLVLFGPSLLTQVGLFVLTTIQTWVRLPAHIQLCSTGFPVGFRVTAFHSRCHGLMVGRYRGESASPSIRGRNYTCTKTKLSKTLRSRFLVPGPKLAGA